VLAIFFCARDHVQVALGLMVRKRNLYLYWGLLLSMGFEEVGIDLDILLPFFGYRRLLKIAVTGQAGSQAPQSIHSSGLI
jgi:hypothetical protein